MAWPWRESGACGAEWLGSRRDDHVSEGRDSTCTSSKIREESRPPQMSKPTAASAHAAWPWRAGGGAPLAGNLVVATSRKRTEIRSAVGLPPLATPPKTSVTAPTTTLECGHRYHTACLRAKHRNRNPLRLSEYKMWCLGCQDCQVQIP